MEKNAIEWDNNDIRRQIVSSALTVVVSTIYMEVVEIHNCFSSYQDVNVDSYVDLVHFVDDMVVIVFAFDEALNFVVYSVVEIVV